MVEFTRKAAKRLIRDALEFEQQTKNTLPNVGRTRPNPPALNSLIVRVRNQTGAALAIGSPVLLKYSDENVDSTDNAFRFGDVFWGYTPTGAANELSIGVVTEVIEAGRVGQVVIKGAATVWASITDGDHSCVELSGSTFVSSTTGFPILAWKTQISGVSISAGSQYVQVLLGGGGSGGADIKLVMIDDDIPGSMEYDPGKSLTEAEIEATLTEDEVAAGYTVVFQDPPDDDYDVNHVDGLNLWGYKRTQLSLKYFTADPLVNAGTADDGGASTITLETGASTVDDFYVGDTISLTGGVGSGQTKTITAYDGETLIATVGVAWATEPDSTTEYEITSALDKVLATTIIDDPEHEPPRKIVRYATTSVGRDDGEPFYVGEYAKADYPDYPENEAFPPSLPDGFLNRRYRGVAINGVFIRRFCKQLPAPPLPE